jgi:hypothetical protein
MTDDKRALSAEERDMLREYATDDAQNGRSDAELSGRLTLRLLTEHDALKAERNAALRDLAEAREQLADSREAARSSAVAYAGEIAFARAESAERFKLINQWMDECERAAVKQVLLERELAACRRERDEARAALLAVADGQQALIDRFGDDGGAFSRLRDRLRGIAGAAQHQSAPSEREAPAYVNEPDPDMDDGLLNTIERSRHAPQPDAPSEREAPLATMRADECSCVDHGCCGISYAGCPVHDLPIGSDAAPQPAEATGAHKWQQGACALCGLARRRTSSGRSEFLHEDGPNSQAGPCLGKRTPSVPAEATGAELTSAICELGRCHECLVLEGRHAHDCVTGGKAFEAYEALHAKPASAPPSATPRVDAGVTHEEARAAYASLNVDPDTGPLGVYIRQQAERDRAHAELERRARELRLALLGARLREYQQVIGKSTVKALLTPSDWEAVKRADDAVAELLGERSDSSEGGERG